MQRGICRKITKSIASVLAFSCAIAVQAATVGVSLVQLSPDPVYIKVGESVNWVEADEDFGPYGITGPWGSFIVPGSVQFNSQGTFNYTAQSVFGGNWSGSVVVRANSKPVVTITSPTNHSVFTAPASFAFEADASDADPDDISDVEFWVGNIMVDDVFYAPYATIVTNLSAGTYTLRAIVWDYSSAKATNSITITVVNPGPITLTASTLAAGKFQFQANGLIAGKTNVLQSSTNLASPLNWVSILTNVAEGSNASFTNPVTSGSRFYRLLQLP